jgi:hypothetical protein
VTRLATSSGEGSSPHYRRHEYGVSRALSGFEFRFRKRTVRCLVPIPAESSVLVNKKKKRVMLSLCLIN